METTLLPTPPMNSFDMSFDGPSLPTDSGNPNLLPNEDSVGPIRRQSIDNEQTASRKRTRATPEQLIMLEDIFLTTPSPSISVREHLSLTLTMNERSIQIWFQNRRAKQRLQIKRANAGEPVYGTKRGSLSTFGAEFSPKLGQFTMPTKVPNALINNSLLLTIETLSIGAWKRAALTSEDLLCSFSLSESIIRWQIVEGTNSFKLEAPISAVLNISLEPSKDASGKGILTVELFQPPIFFMEVKASTSSSWTQCRDFTEGHQATSNMKHVFTTSNFSCLASELMTIMSNNDYLSRVTQISDPAASPIPHTALFNTALFDESRRGSAPAGTSFFGPDFRRGSLFDGNLSSDSPILSPLATPLTASLALDMSPSPLNISLFPDPSTAVSAGIGSPFGLSNPHTLNGLDSAISAGSNFEFGAGPSPSVSNLSGSSPPLYDIDDCEGFLTSIRDFLA